MINWLAGNREGVVPGGATAPLARDSPADWSAERGPEPSRSGLAATPKWQDRARRCPPDPPRGLEPAANGQQ